MSIVRGLIRRILADPARRRELGVRFIMAMQEHEGRDANRAEAERAYDAVRLGLTPQELDDQVRLSNEVLDEVRAEEKLEADIAAAKARLKAGQENLGYPMPEEEQEALDCHIDEMERELARLRAPDHGDDERRDSQGK